jgi:hypothetical protein
MTERRPYCVTIRLGAPVAINHPWIAGDALLEHLAFARQLGREQYNLPAFTPFDRSSLGPDPWEDSVYCRAGLRFASAIEFGPMPKLGSLDYFARIDEGLPKRKVYLGIGPYRAWQMRWVYVAAEWARFWGFGRVDLVRDLVSDLVGLGNDTRVGWGHVLSVEVDECDEDRSVVADGKATRPIPVRFLRSWSDAAPLAWKPPYWDRASVELCAPPGAEVDFGGPLRKVLRAKHYGLVSGSSFRG